MNDTANVAYVHNGILLSHKESGILPPVTSWMDLEGSLLSEKNQGKMGEGHQKGQTYSFKISHGVMQVRKQQLELDMEQQTGSK